MSTNISTPFNSSEELHAFFSAISPDFRKLKRKHKRDFKLKLMRLLNDLLKKDEGEVDTECKCCKRSFIHLYIFTISQDLLIILTSAGRNGKKHLVPYNYILISRLTIKERSTL